ncbi:MAG: tRNA lysidine(34) synthetase TilS [Clostridia bacterium]|nr:tRNA lysidine(34) synthetase TilS [Clostridia bacterium]
MSNMNITEKFSAALEVFDLRGGVLIALSGGADSVCLANLFLDAKRCGNFGFELAAAHLNHSLRGEEANRDENFCREFCEKNGIRFFSKKLDINKMASESGRSTEEEARVARYSFFEDILKSESCLSYVATAHNKNDLAETILLNMVRGSGIDGLRSIPKRRDNIIRPILDASRKEILGYLDEKGVKYVTDSTNLTDEYSRNKIRLNVMPHLASISEGYLECICRTSSLLAKDAEYLNAEADKVYGEVVFNGAMHTKKAQNLHRAMLPRVIKRLYNNSGFSSLEETHIDAICNMLHIGKENFSLSLHGCDAICERGILRFAKKESASIFSLPIKIGEKTVLPTKTEVLLSKEKLCGSVPLKADALCGNLVLRSRKDGDTIRQKGKTHKIKRMISDKKLCQSEKDGLFFLTCDDEIIYTNLPAIADKAFTKGGENCIYLLTKENLTL